MDFDDLFEHKRRHYGSRHHVTDDEHFDRGRDSDGYHLQRTGDRGDTHRDSYASGDLGLPHLLRQILANKVLAIGAVILILALLGLALLVLVPILGELLGYVDKNGVKGIIERLWQGSAK